MGHNQIPITKTGMLKRSRKNNWRPGMRKVNQHAVQVLYERQEGLREGLKHIFEKDDDRIQMLNRNFERIFHKLNNITEFLNG